jgi:hypothetical protein
LRLRHSARAGACSARADERSAPLDADWAVGVAPACSCGAAAGRLRSEGRPAAGCARAAAEECRVGESAVARDWDVAEATPAQAIALPV